MVCKDTMRQVILEAAYRRFVHYGYGKTTMAELAADCDMTAGNLYRYFPSKLDIAAAICLDAYDETLVRLRGAAQLAGASAADRLREFLFRELTDTFSMLEDDPRIFEMAEIIKRERPDIANRNLAKSRAIMAEILSAGNADDEFAIADVIETAEMIQAATMKFRFPQLFSALGREALERELSGVFGLILDGLTPRKAALPTVHSSR